MKIETLNPKKYQAISEYAQIAWASYAEGLNQGMFSDLEEQWGVDWEGNFYNQSRVEQLASLKQISLPSYFQVLTQNISTPFSNLPFTSQQAKIFISRYRVKEVLINKDCKVKATLFCDTHSNQLILGFGGFDCKTVFTQENLDSGKITKAQCSLELFKTLLTLSSLLKEKYQGQKICIVGHLFGGYLAQIFCFLQPQLVEQVYIFDPFGIIANPQNTKIFFGISDHISSLFSLYSTHKISHEDRASIAIQEGFITFNKQNSKLEKFIPFYLRQNNSDQDKKEKRFQALSSFAQKLCDVLQNESLVGQTIAIDFSLKDFHAQKRLKNPAIIFVDEEEEGLKKLNQQLKDSNHTLPSPLQQSQIHSFYTITSSTQSLNTRFGDCINSTQYDYIFFNQAINPNELRFFDQILEEKTSNSSQKINSSFLATHSFALTDIKKIYTSFLILSKCKDNTPIASLRKLQESCIFFPENSITESDLHYELNYPTHSHIPLIDCLISSPVLIEPLSPKDIQALKTDSQIQLLRALYACKSFALLNLENLRSKYQSNFYKIFQLYHDCLTPNYIQARKALYQTVLSLKDYPQSGRKTSLKSKKGEIIFLKSQQNLSELIHIYDNKCDIFTQTNTCLNVEELKKNYNLSPTSYKIQLFFYSTLLTGGSQNPNHPLYFGKIDKEGNFLSPTYKLIEPKEDSAHLKIFLHTHTLTVLHYSFSEQSLGIKLEQVNQEEKQEENKKQETNQKKEEEKEDLAQQTLLATFTPIIEDDTLMCPHGGKVNLQSQKGQKFKSNGVALILESDLKNSSITGCSNPPLLGGPCTKIAIIPPTSLSQKKFNAQGAPLQEYASTIMTDKGVPLICIPKPNQFKVFQPSNSQTQNSKTEEQSFKLTLERPRLRVHFKDSPFALDNIPIFRLYNDDEETKDENAIKEIELKLKESSHPLAVELKKQYDKNYEIKEARIRIAFSFIKLIFIIPTKIPKIYKHVLEKYEDKNYGVGHFQLLESYSADVFKEGELEHIRVFFAPARLEKICLDFALGIDSKIPLKANECDFTIIMGGRDE